MSETPSRTFYLIDGHAQIFRAYYAIRTPMSSPVTGEPTGAIFAFTNMLLKLFDQFRPEYVAVAIDMAGKTFRDEMYDQYKATRDPPPDDFHPQEHRIFQIIRLFGIPILGQEGVEADDIIATVARRVLDAPECRDVKIRIISKDKDLEQLLEDRITMFDIHKDTTIDVASLKRDKGITPDQVADVLALTGDKVDNIPGVNGIGPKTATKLIDEYGTIDAIFENLDKIKGKRHDNLEKARPHMDLVRQLVRLKDDVDIPFDFSKARAGTVDAAQLRNLFEELGFHRHRQDLDRLLRHPARKTEASAGAFPTGLFESAVLNDAVDEASDEELGCADDCDYRAVTTTKQLDELITILSQQKLISVDTETIGLGHSAALSGICLAWKSGAGVYVPVQSPETSKHLSKQQVLEKLRPVLENPDLPKCGHNLKYDALVLRHESVKLAGIRFDSMIGSHLANLPAHGLDQLALVLLKHAMIPISRLIGPRSLGARQKTMDQVELEQVVPYAAEDADMALRLTDHLRTMLREMGIRKLADEVEMPLVEVLAEMEHHGIKVDPEELGRQQKALTGRIEQLRQEIYDKAGEPFNIDSPKQLGQLLFKKFKLPVVKRTKTGPSTDMEVLETLAEMDELTPDRAAFPLLILEYRQLTKLVGTYLERLREKVLEGKTGRVHASFHQTGTATGRLSSNNPNLQNIPIRTETGRQIRKAFLAEAGHQLISADYSQIELRILAHLSEDPALLKAFHADQDIHAAVAGRVFNVATDEITPEQRHSAKTINFGIIYGVTAYGLARRIEGLDLEGAKTLIADYRKQFAGIDTFLHKCVAQALEHGFVSTMLGRRRRIPQITSTNANTRSLGERLAINMVVQGSAADLIKLAMVNLHRRIQHEDLPLKLLLQIHDELVLESPEADAEFCAAIVQEEMQGAMSLAVPLNVDVGIGPDWLTAK